MSVNSFVRLHPEGGAEVEMTLLPGGRHFGWTHSSGHS